LTIDDWTHASLNLFPESRCLDLDRGIAYIAFCQSKTKSYNLAKITFTGLKEFEAAQAMKTSGLRKGQKVFLKDIETATQKLAKSGFFESVAYQRIDKRAGLDLEFQVEEAKSLLPCTFDNFVWFGNEELIKAVREKVPLFKGSLPRSGTAKQDATAALQDLIRQRQIPGKIRFSIDTDLDSGKILGYLIQVSGANLTIASLQFRGANAVTETVLQEKANSLIGQQYSQRNVMDFADRMLVPLFKEKGYFRIQFKEPAIEVQPDSTSEAGLKLILNVIENAAYSWDKAVWSGNLPVASESLDQMMEMKTGDIAEKSKIDKGFSAVLSELSRRGYFEARIKETPEFNDVAYKVKYSVQLFAGSKYSMGALSFSGAPENLVRKLRIKWSLPPGEPFDALYPAEFMDANKAEIDPKRIVLIGVRLVPDREKRIVDVTFDFKRK
jgi:outer membrane protein assembly factor BamA